MLASMVRELASSIRDDFSSDVRRRGEEYFYGQAVRIEDVDATSIRATVTGQTDYTVSLEWSGPEIQAFCDCPYFDQNGPCKHLWAVALAYDSTGRSPARLEGKVLVMDDDWDEDVFGDGDDTEDDDEQPRESSYNDRDMEGEIVALGDRIRRSFEPRATPSRPSAWKRLLEGLENDAARGDSFGHRAVLPAEGQLNYLIDIPTTLAGGSLAVHVVRRKRKKNGDWCASQPQALAREQISHLPDPADRQIATLLLGASTQYGYYGYSRPSAFLLHENLADVVMPLLCGSGRCRLQSSFGMEYPPLRIDAGAAWQFRLCIGKDETAGHYVLTGWLCRGQDREPLAAPMMLTKGGWVFWPDRAARLDDHDVFGWVSLLRREKEVRVPAAQGDELLEWLLRAAAVPPMDLPPELGYQEVRPAPQSCLRIRKPDSNWGPERLAAELRFEYDGRRVDPSSPGRGVYLRESRRFILRSGGGTGCHGEAPGAGTAAEHVRTRRFSVARPGSCRAWWPNWSPRTGTSTPMARSTGGPATSRLPYPPGSTGSNSAGPRILAGCRRRCRGC